ncbi:hypothetical protein AKJ09_05748 [Labilithrix luteola]|uniref:Uncharacterized protein n=1 Tax=Labilithrix luteola TaxID=1391654 RepID=A0A0K1Q0Z7_9BACT|nr:hypothetical protein AKJ09_05748 [Labilithrix luteola]
MPFPHFDGHTCAVVHLEGEADRAAGAASSLMVVIVPGAVRLRSTRRRLRRVVALRHASGSCDSGHEHDGSCSMGVPRRSWRAHFEISNVHWEPLDAEGLNGKKAWAPVRNARAFSVRAPSHATCRIHRSIDVALATSSLGRMPYENWYPPWGGCRTKFGGAGRHPTNATSDAGVDRSRHAPGNVGRLEFASRSL